MSNESVQQLFSKFPVTELRALAKKTRHEIETKKEDLRQMVGERYRDLIEAADTIAEMKKCAVNVKESVCSVQKYNATELKVDKLAYSKPKENVFSVGSYLELSAQVKLLMEVSETIWSRIEGGNMIEATHLYMQSRQVLKNLSLDGSTTYCPILQWFPVLGQQAQALDNLRSTILTECRRLLKDNALHSKSISEALCSIILLEESDITKAFNEFMDARFCAINEKFLSSEEVGTAKLCKVVTLLAATLKQAHVLFVAQVQNSQSAEEGTIKRKSKISISTGYDIGLVQHALKESYKSFSEKCTDYEKSGSTCEEKYWSKHLPDSVARLKSLHISETNSALTPDFVQSTCSQWLEKCENSIKNGILELLSYVNTFKALAVMRQSIWNTIIEISDVKPKISNETDAWKVGILDSGDSKPTEWEASCISTLGRRLSLWDEILKSLFLDKVKSLSQNSFFNLLETGKQKLNEALENLKTISLNSETTNEFIWHELSSDILPDTAWKQVSLRRGKEVKGRLALKALTVTPPLHNLCQQLDSSMRQVIGDLSSYIPNVNMENQPDRNLASEKKSSPVVSKEEKEKICSDFQQACVGCLRGMLTALHERKSSLTERLSSEISSVDEILFLAMFCRNFCVLCDEFQTGCSLGLELREESTLKRQLSSSMSQSTLAQSVQPTISPAWEEICSNMSKESDTFLQLWSDATVSKAITKFKSSVLNLKLAINFFDTMPTWDNVTIEEESETGSKVKSEIKLPMAVSWPVQELLYDVCENISRVGGHSMSRTTLQNVAQSLLFGVLHSYVELKKVVLESVKIAASNSTSLSGSLPFTVTQSWALQRLYDLRTLHGLLHMSQVRKTTKDDSKEHLYDVPKDSYHDLVDWLESYIDPFDLDVFSPHLIKNIQRSIQCSSVMLGFISASDKSDTVQSSHSATKSGGNSHNILPLTPDCGRFSYLPISSRMSKSDTVALPASIKNHLPLSTALKQLTEVDKKMEGGRKQSLYSKLGALSSSWLSMATADN
ncbi:conserved oligomeric Golgi complex subunit 1-like [Styela clava]